VLGTGLGCGLAGLLWLSSAQAGPSTPAGDPPPPDRLLALARSEIEQLRYDDAIAAVLPLLSNASKRLRVEALEITAAAHLVVGRLSEGRAALAALYTIAPGFVLRDPSLPPRVTSEFDAAASESYGRTVAIVVRPVDSDAQEFDVVAAGDTAHFELACRSSEADSFVPMSTSRTSTSFRFRLPTAATYWCRAVALDADDLPLGRLGSDRAPFDVKPHAVRDHPITSTWWFWSALGALVVGSAAVTYAVTRSGPPPPAADATVSLVHPSVASW
jgi:hypothetical protein